MMIVFCLCGCGHLASTVLTDPYERDLNERKQAMMRWIGLQKAEVEAGTLKNKRYYVLLRRKILELRPDLTHYLVFADEMIKVSWLYEEGRITREQLEEKDRELTALVGEEERRRAAILGRVSSAYVYETDQFTLYKTSLLKDYTSGIETRLREAGPQYSITDCTVVGDRILCATRQ